MMRVMLTIFVSAGLLGEGVYSKRNGYHASAVAWWLIMAVVLVGHMIYAFVSGMPLAGVVFLLALFMEAGIVKRFMRQ